jgi:PPOX class probable F420-dependent enzyme
VTADLTGAQAAFLRDNPYYGVVTTLRADGSPHTTVVWVDVDGDGAVSFNTPRGSAKQRHVDADPRLTLMVVNPGDAYHWVCVTGRGTATAEGADAQIDRLAKKYLGVDEYPRRRPGVERMTVRIAPTRVETAGFE